MKINKIISLDFIVDKLTNSIQNTISGDSFATEVLRLTKADFTIKSEPLTEEARTEISEFIRDYKKKSVRKIAKPGSKSRQPKILPA